MVTFGGMLLIILHLIGKKNFVEAVPIMALYAFAGYRFMPALQQIYSSISQLKFIHPVLNSLYEDLKNLNYDLPTISDSNFIFKEEIKVRDLNFSYPNTSKLALNNINLKIKNGNRIGIVGSTGSGKSTFIDVLIGLLTQTSGTIKIDNIDIKDYNKNWQSSIGYVPQEIYLSDDTIAANIAFGVSKEKIDNEKLINASKVAQIYSFIKNI